MTVSSLSLVLAMERWHKWISAHSFGSPVVDEESMRPDHWLGSVFYVPCSGSTLLVGWQEGHLTHKKHATDPNVSFHVLVEEEGTGWPSFNCRWPFRNR